MNNAKRKALGSILERGCVGVCHKIPPRCPNRYVMECEGRHDDREPDTIDRMGGKRLRYRTLTNPDDLPSGARG